jgi:hypothetical protein
MTKPVFYRQQRLTRIKQITTENTPQNFSHNPTFVK